MPAAAPEAPRGSPPVGSVLLGPKRPFLPKAVKANSSYVSAPSGQMRWVLLLAPTYGCDLVMCPRSWGRKCWGRVLGVRSGSAPLHPVRPARCFLQSELECPRPLSPPHRVPLGGFGGPQSLQTRMGVREVCLLLFAFPLLLSPSLGCSLQLLSLPLQVCIQCWRLCVRA